MVDLKRDDYIEVIKPHDEECPWILRIMSRKSGAISMNICPDGGRWLVEQHGNPLHFHLGYLWDNCPRWDWAREVLEKLDAPLYQIGERWWGERRLLSPVYTGPDFQDVTMETVHRYYSPFLEDLVEKQPDTVPKEAADVLVAALDFVACSHVGLATGHNAKVAVAEYRRLVGEDKENSIRDKAVRAMQEAAYISMDQAAREHRIAENVHILEEALERIMSQCTSGDNLCTTAAKEALAAYRAAVEEKPKPEDILNRPVILSKEARTWLIEAAVRGTPRLLFEYGQGANEQMKTWATEILALMDLGPHGEPLVKPERGQKYRNKKTGAILLYSHTCELRGLVDIYLGSQLDAAHVFMVPLAEFDHDWEPMEEET